MVQYFEGYLLRTSFHLLLMSLRRAFGLAGILHIDLRTELSAADMLAASRT